jgi:hypothetical protein
MLRGVYGLIVRIILYCDRRFNMKNDNLSPAFQKALRELDEVLEEVQETHKAAAFSDGLADATERISKIYQKGVKREG